MRNCGFLLPVLTEMENCLCAFYSPLFCFPGEKNKCKTHQTKGEKLVNMLLLHVSAVYLPVCSLNSPVKHLVSVFGSVHSEWVCSPTTTRGQSRPHNTPECHLFSLHKMSIWERMSLTFDNFKHLSQPLSKSLPRWKMCQSAELNPNSATY